MVGFAITNYEHTTHKQHNHEKSYSVVVMGLSHSHSLCDQRSGPTFETMEMFLDMSRHFGILAGSPLNVNRDTTIR